MNHPAYAKEEPAKFAIAWKIPVNGMKSIGFSPGGKFFYIADAGKIRVFSSAGKMQLSSKVPYATDASVSPDGSYIAVYSKRNPSNSEITILDATGAEYWKMDVAGAVWSVDACSTRNGARFAVGTGDGYVYILDVGHNRKRYKRWRAPGAVVSINIVPSGKQVVLGTWQESSVVCATDSGSNIWKMGAKPADLQYIKMLDSYRRIIVRSIPNRMAADGMLYLLNNDGRTTLSRKLSGTDNSHIIYSPSGRYICMAYEKSIEYKRKSMQESHAVLIDNMGRQLWDKGSSFFPVHPVMVTARGSMLISSVKNTFYVISRSGEMKPSVKLPADILHSIPSPDGNSVLIYCGNGSLYKFAASTK